MREQGTLERFVEHMLGLEIRVFGHVAVALAGCEMHENERTVTRDVSAFLLLKDGGHWRIAAQGWDRERADLPLPPALLQR